MFKKTKLFLKLIGVSFRSHMQHRSSFFMLTLAYFLSTFVEIAGILVLFDRFKELQGWTLPELALIYGIINMGFAIAEAMARGFDQFSQLVKNGDFDRVLLRPLGTLLQIATREIQLMRMGRFLQGLVVLSWSFSKLELAFFSSQTFIIALAIMGTACLFYGLFIIQATFCFWTVETLEIMNIATFGGQESGQYPIVIYPWAFRMVFTFLIPIAAVVYYPVSAILQRDGLSLWIGVITPFAGILFLYVSCRLWRLGVRHYHSTGS